MVEMDEAKAFLKRLRSQPANKVSFLCCTGMPLVVSLYCPSYETLSDDLGLDF